MNEERIMRMRRALEKQELDALVVRLPENVLLLSGYWPLCGWVYYVFPLDGRPLCILPHTEEREAAAELWDSDCSVYTFGTIDSEDQVGRIKKALSTVVRGRSWKRVGYEADFEAVAPAWNAAEGYIPASTAARMLQQVFGARRLVDATNLIHEQRACKTAYELEKLKIANEIALFGMRAFSRAVVPGVSGVELSAAVESAVMTEGTGYSGARRVRAFTQIAVGPEECSMGWRPMEITTKRRLLPSEPALLELAVVADGYWSDRTRPRVAGRATPLQQDVLEIVRNAQRAAIDAVRPGVSAADVDATARNVISEAGYEKQFMHITGHGVGFGYHEKIPIISPQSGHVLKEGMVHSVEPGVYFPEMGGIRIEDDILVGPAGPEILMPYSSDID